VRRDSDSCNSLRWPQVSLHSTRAQKHLERSHQRGCARAVKNFGEVVFREVELEQAEITKIYGNQMLENGVTKALSEEGFIPDKDIGRTQLARLQFADKSFGLGESPHSETLQTASLAVSRWSLANPQQSTKERLAND
jgi:hypothetical protein